MKKQTLVLYGLIFLSLSLSGFSSSDMVIREDVLAADPGFAEILEKKERMDEAIENEKSALRKKENLYKGKINVLKTEFKNLKTQARMKIDDLRGSLDPEITTLDENILSLKVTLRQKKRFYEDLKKTSTSIERMIKKNKDIDELNDETEQWYERLASLRVQMIPLREEINLTEDRLDLETKKRRLLSKFSLHLFLEKMVIFVKNTARNLIDKRGSEQ